MIIAIDPPTKNISSENSRVQRADVFVVGGKDPAQQTWRGPVVVMVVVVRVCSGGSHLASSPVVDLLWLQQIARLISKGVALVGNHSGQLDLVELRAEGPHRGAVATVGNDLEVSPRAVR